MVINQTLARQEFPGQDPLGRYVYAGRDASPWQIVGVVADVRQFGLDQDPQPQFFADFRQWWTTDPVFFTILGPYYAIRGGADVQALVPHVRNLVHGLDAEAGLYNVATMEQLVSNSLSRPRMYATLLGMFAGVAVVLSAVGIYGVIAYAVAQRTREIGIRMALGAARTDVVRLVLGQSLTWTAIGIALGLGGAAAMTRYLDGLLYGLTPLDASTFVVASLTFLLIAFVASYVPARRATRVDPVIALRSE
jgi:ABC-type antimicrobial peptide transport system permease subunit